MLLLKKKFANTLLSGAIYLMSTFLAKAAREEGITVLLHLKIGRLHSKHATSLTETLMAW